MDESSVPKTDPKFPTEQKEYIQIPKWLKWISSYILPPLCLNRETTRFPAHRMWDILGDNANVFEVSQEFSASICMLGQCTFSGINGVMIIIITPLFECLFCALQLSKDFMYNRLIPHSNIMKEKPLFFPFIIKNMGTKRFTNQFKYINLKKMEIFVRHSSFCSVTIDWHPAPYHFC